LTLYQHGKTLREEGKQVEAMRAFIRATHCQTENDALLGRVYSNMANMCRQADDHQTAFEVYQISAQHFAKSYDSLAYAYALNNMAWEQAAMKHKQHALSLVDSAITCYPYVPLTEKVIETKAAACFFKQEYDSVLYYTASSHDSDYLLMLRAQAFSFLQMDDSATFYAKLLLPRMINPFYLDDLYYILTHNDAAADKETLLRLTSDRADVQKQIKERHGQLALAVHLLQQDLHPQKQSLSIWFILLIVSGLALLIWLIYIAYQQYLLHAEKAKFEQTRIQELNANKQLLLESEDIRQELVWNDYEALRREINKRFFNLATKLQDMDLNEQDIRMCILVLIGLSHKETAEMLNCSPKSIGKLKDLTARKLGVSGGQLQEKLLKTAIL
jgi:DNA-binding CsgD family transcriptional regulator